MQTLADYLVENEIQKKAFAAELGVDPSIVSKICAGKIRPSLDIAFRIKRLTGGKVPFEVWISPDELPQDPAFWREFFARHFIRADFIAEEFCVDRAIAIDWLKGSDMPRGLHALQACAIVPNAFRSLQGRAA